jgi:hypothetical protein
MFKRLTIAILMVMFMATASLAWEEYTGTPDAQTPEPAGEGTYVNEYGNTIRKHKGGCDTCWRKTIIRTYRPPERHIILPGSSSSSSSGSSGYKKPSPSYDYGTEKYNPASPSYQSPIKSMDEESSAYIFQKPKRRLTKRQKESERQRRIDEAIWKSRHGSSSAFCFIDSLF